MKSVEVKDSEYITLTKAAAQAGFPYAARLIGPLARYLTDEGVPVKEVGAGFVHLPSGKPARTYFVSIGHIKEFEAALQKRPDLREDVMGNERRLLGNQTLRRR